MTFRDRIPNTWVEIEEGWWLSPRGEIHTSREAVVEMSIRRELPREVVNLAITQGVMVKR